MREQTRLEIDRDKAREAVEMARERVKCALGGLEAADARNTLRMAAGRLVTLMEVGA